MKKYLLVGMIAAISIVISGCLLTGQITIVQDIDVGVTTDDQINHAWLNLNVNEDYADNIDKIKSIDAVSFVAHIFNDTTPAAHAELYISSDSLLDNVEEIRDQAILVFSSPIVPAEDSFLVRWNDSFQYMYNIDSLIHYVRDVGQFAIYGIADSMPFKDSISAEIVITMTIGK